jgi:RNA polymerase sigma-70 factor (ECF subfamily)
MRNLLFLLFSRISQRYFAHGARVGIQIALFRSMLKTIEKNKQKNLAIEQAICFEIGMLERMALKYTGDLHEAEDLVQDTLVLALRFIGSYQENTNLRAWLSRVMRNRYISIVRRRKVELRIHECEGAYALSERSISSMGRRNIQTEGGVENDNGFSDTVVSAMKDLHPVFREAVLLCDVQGLSYAEAAAKISCPAGTIMSRLHRGRRSLRKRLGSRRQVQAA